MTITIRPATEDDLPLVLEFIRDLAEYERLPHEVVADIPTLREFLFGDRPAAEIILAEEDGTTPGFALFFTSFSTFLGRPGIYLEDLFVKPEARGRGVGNALLSHLAMLTIQRRYGRLEWSVLDWNELAIGFYRSLGAQPMSDWTVYRVTGDALAGLAARTKGTE